MSLPAHYRGHSAEVDMHLQVNGTSLSVAQLGPDFLILETPAEHSPCVAWMHLRVDDSESDWPIRLPQGISPDSRRVTILPAE